MCAFDYSVVVSSTEIVGVVRRMLVSHALSVVVPPFFFGFCKIFLKPCH